MEKLFACIFGCNTCAYNSNKNIYINKYDFFPPPYNYFILLLVFILLIYMRI